MNDTERALYTALMSTRNNEVNLRWTRNQLFFLINSGAITFVVSQFKVENDTYLTACVIGLALSILWFCMMIIAGFSVRFWHGRLQAIEDRIQDTTVRIFNTLDFAESQKGLTTHRLLLTLIGIFTFIWILLIGNWYLAR